MAMLRGISQFIVLLAGGVIAPACGQQAKPDLLLAVDQNRATVIERIVGQWGEPLAQSDTGITPAQLREMLYGLRADYLLGASLAGSLSGLRDVLATAVVSTAPVKANRVSAIASMNLDGVALAAIQGLHQLMQQKDREIAQLERKLRVIEVRLG